MRLFLQRLPIQHHCTSKQLTRSRAGFRVASFKKLPENTHLPAGVDKGTARTPRLRVGELAKDGQHKRHQDSPSVFAGKISHHLICELKTFYLFNILLLLQANN